MIGQKGGCVQMRESKTQFLKERKRIPAQALADSAACLGAQDIAQVIAASVSVQNGNGNVMTKFPY